VATDSESRVFDLKTMAVVEPVGTARWDSHFTGIHALDRTVLQRVPEGFGCIVRTAYLELVLARKLAGIHPGGIWLDVGDPKAYLETNLAVLRGEVCLHLDPMSRATWWTRTGGVVPDTTVCVEGAAWVGAGIVFGASVTLKDCVVGDGAVIEPESSLENCVVWPGVKVAAGRWRNHIFYDHGVLEIGSVAKRGAVQ
jgi:NDP-sugar pyrophosphorylase family protein